MTFTATPAPDSSPPRVRLDVVADEDGASFTELSITRDGVLIREQPFAGGAAAVAFDFEAPFGRSVTYAVSGSRLPASTPDWSESWPNLSNWSGDTSDWSTAAGVASSSVAGASIVRSASGTIERLSVDDPAFVRVELLSAADVVVASVEVGASSVAVTGDGSPSVVSGGGSFTASLTSGTVNVSAVDSSWSVSRTYAGTAAKVRVVSLGAQYAPGDSFSTVGQPFGVAVDSSGSVYVTDLSSNLVRKFDSSGSQTLQFSTVDEPGGLALDSSGNIYVACSDDNRVRKFDSSGSQTLQFSTTGAPIDVAVDSSGYIYVTDNDDNLVREFNASGTEVFSFSTGSEPAGIALDSSGNIYVTKGYGVRKFDASGTQTLQFSTAGGLIGLAVDSAGTIYAADYSNRRIRAFDAAGTPATSFSTVGFPYGVAVDSAGTIYVSDATDNLIRTFTPVDASIGAVSVTPPITPEPYSATVTTSLDVTEAWLIHPIHPTLSQPIDRGPGRWNRDSNYVESGSGETKTSEDDRAVHRYTGRARAVVVTHGARQADEWPLVIGCRTIANKDAIRALVDDQTPLLLRSPDFGWDLQDDWYSIGQVTTVRVDNPVITEETLTTCPLTPTDPPIVRQGALYTWGDVLTDYATWDDVIAANASWLELITGQNAPSS